MSSKRDGQEPQRSGVSRVVSSLLKRSRSTPDAQIAAAAAAGAAAAELESRRPSVPKMQRSGSDGIPQRGGKDSDPLDSRLATVVLVYLEC